MFTNDQTTFASLVVPWRRHQTFYTWQKFWKWTKICLANCRCQSPRRQQVNSCTHEQPLNEVFDLISESRERRVWHAAQLKLALHRVLLTLPTLHRGIVLVRSFCKSISYKIENILSEIHFASNFWSAYIPSNFSSGTASLSTKRIMTLNSYAQHQVCHELRRNSVWISPYLMSGVSEICFFRQVMP